MSENETAQVSAEVAEPIVEVISTKVDKSLIPKPPSQPASGSVGQDKETSPDSSHDLGTLMQFALRGHTYVNDYIKFADQKAAFIVALCSGMLGLLYKSAAQAHFLKPLSQWQFIDLMTFLGFAILSISIILSFLVIKPQKKPKKNSGLLFWGTVSEIDSANDYLKQVLKLSNQGIADELLDHNYRLSKVCSDKYWFLDWAVITCAIGVILSIIVLAVI